MKEMKTLKTLLRVAICVFALPVGMRAQEWTTPVRGSWVRATAQSDPGDVALAGNGDGCEIVVSSDEHSAVHQAATFLADDIERISGYKPPIVSQPTGQRATVRLVTLAPSHVVPEAIARQRLDGHWEAYQIKT